MVSYSFMRLWSAQWLELEKRKIWPPQTTVIVTNIYSNYNAKAHALELSNELMINEHERKQISYDR